jgi:SAM-dependent methyltransferase
MKSRESCPGCNSSISALCFRVNGYAIMRCSVCATMYVETLPTPAQLAAIYTTATYYELPAASMKRIASENTRRLSLIRKIQPKGTFLDIGCAHGLLLDQAKDAGYQTYGVEPTATNAVVASAKGHTIFNGWLTDFAVQSNSKQFDVITCMDVIEHIDDPLPFLQIATSLLAPGGLMVISTPNYSGVVAKLLGQSDPYMTPPEHITFFTMQGMQRLTLRCGLQVQMIKCFGSLVRAEMDRSIDRYIPKALHFLSPAIRIVVSSAFHILNWMKLGLEQELYLSKSQSN